VECARIRVTGPPEGWKEVSEPPATCRAHGPEAENSAAGVGVTTPAMHVKPNRITRPAIVATLVGIAIPTFALGQPSGPSRASTQRSRPALVRSTPSHLFDLAMPAAAPQRTYWDGGDRARRKWEARQLAAITPPVVKLERAAQPVASSSSSQGGGSSGTANWYAIASCESSGRWDLNSGNGYWGGLQFTPSTWFAYGGSPFDGVGPFPYSAGEQIAVAERVLAGQGPGAWPNCFVWA
jgi:hypothetical protein